jgi:uncharacterized protein DUF2637
MKQESWARASAITGQFLWVIILIPILGVSGYSFYIIARYFGVPPIVAIAMSTCFDGVALLAATYAIRYAEKGLNGSGPRMAVRLFVAIGAFHARITHEPNGAWILWASLPIAAAVVYEIHLRWAKKEALARADSSSPAFGALSWILFPLDTLSALRDVIRQRMEFVRAQSLRRTKVVGIIAEDNEPKAPPRLHTVGGRKRSKHAPVAHIRRWAKQQPEYASRVGDFARLPADVVDAYYRAHQRSA